MELEVEKGDWLILKKNINVAGEIFNKGIHAEVMDIEDFIPKLRILKNDVEHIVYCISSDLFEKIDIKEPVNTIEEIDNDLILKKGMIVENTGEIIIDKKVIKKGSKFLVMTNEEYPFIIMNSEDNGMFLKTKMNNKKDFIIVDSNMENTLQKWNIKEIKFYNEDSFFNSGYQIILEKNGRSLNIKSHGLMKKVITVLSDKEIIDDLLSDIKKVLYKDIEDKNIIEYFSEYIALRNYAFKTFNKFIDEKKENKI